MLFATIMTGSAALRTVSANTHTHKDLLIEVVRKQSCDSDIKAYAYRCIYTWADDNSVKLSWLGLRVTTASSNGPTIQYGGQ